MIEGEVPIDWRELETRVRQILNESGLTAETQVELRLARGRATVDVLARDPTSTPPTLYVCECKHWKTRVPRNDVHAFRSVVMESGANIGFLISSGGFQSGAFEVANLSNVELVTWPQFQNIFVSRWYQNYMAPALDAESDALCEYTEPINSRIALKADALPPESQERFGELRRRYAQPTMFIMLLSLNPFGIVRPPELPLRPRLSVQQQQYFPSDVLDTVALRPLMAAITAFCRRATAEFDEIFGGRA